MRPGSDTVTITKPGLTADRLHRVTGSAPASADVPHCSFQPLGVKDDISNTAYSSATHRAITPPDDAAWNCFAEDKITVYGQTYRVRGVKRHRDRGGKKHHVTIYAEEEH